MTCMHKQVFTIWLILFSIFGLLDGKSYSKPVNCAQYECPSYKVIKTQKTYEIRRYPKRAWVSSPLISSNSFIGAANKGFLILYNYTQGKNDQAAKFNLTAPVFIDIYPAASTGYSCSPSTYAVYFYVPRNYQKHPPLSDEIQLVYLPKHEYAAVKRFGGYINDTNIAPQVLGLKNSLQGTLWESAITAPHPYSTAAYNAPFETENRVNELIIWFDT